MQDINSVVKDYLKKQTNYALLITGKWGVGKTYYYNHTLVYTIKSTETKTNALKNYKPIHVSLFGLSSIEEIQTQIFLSIHPLLKNKVVKLSAGLCKSIARGMLALKNLGNIDDYISDVKPKSGEWLNLNELVICFDDLERRSANLEMNELIGYINSLVEHNDTKVILIANQDKIIDEVYTDFKEKVIGVTIEYVPDFKTNVQAIIKDKYSMSYKSYSQFLQENVSIIYEYKKAYDNNLRSLIHSLDNLHFIYSDIKTNILDLQDEKKTLVNEKLEFIIRFTIAVSIEFKKHNLSLTNKKDLDKPSGFSWGEFDIGNVSIGSISGNDSDQKEDKSFRDNFISSYYQHSSDYQYFESIYEYVTGGSKFRVDKLILEINNAYNIEEEKVAPQYEILNKLDYLNYYRLTDKEYRALTKIMVKYAEEGKYKIGDYVTVFHFAMRFDNLLNYKPNALKNRIIKGIKNGKPNFVYIPNLDFYINISHEVSFKNELLEIKKACNSINDTICKEDSKKEAINFISLVKSDWEFFKEEIVNPDCKWRFTPVFNYSSPNDIYNFINDSTSLQKIREFADIIRKRYENTYNLEDELPFLIEFQKKLLRGGKKRKVKSLKNHLLNLLAEKVKVAINRFGE